MKKDYKIPVLVSLIFIVFFSFVYADIITTTSQGNPTNITFSENSTQLITIDVPKYSYFQTFNLSIEGFNNTVSLNDLSGNNTGVLTNWTYSGNPISTGSLFADRFNDGNTTNINTIWGYDGSTFKSCVWNHTGNSCNNDIFFDLPTLFPTYRMYVITVDSKTYNIIGTSFTPTSDRKMRKAFSFTVQLRNLVKSL